MTVRLLRNEWTVSVTLHPLYCIVPSVFTQRYVKTHMILHCRGVVDAQNGPPLQLDHRSVKQFPVKPHNHSRVTDVEHVQLRGGNRTIK